MNINSPYHVLRRKILFEYMEKFKDTPSKTIAKILVRDHSEFFENIEYARSLVRTYRGKNGKWQRKSNKITQFYQS